jgi:hypothetical protein
MTCCPRKLSFARPRISTADLNLSLHPYRARASLISLFGHGPGSLGRTRQPFAFSSLPETLSVGFEGIKALSGRLPLLFPSPSSLAFNYSASNPPSLLPSLLSIPSASFSSPSTVYILFFDSYTRSITTRPTMFSKTFFPIATLSAITFSVAQAQLATVCVRPSHSHSFDPSPLLASFFPRTFIHIA